MEEGLLVKERFAETSTRWGEIREEMKRLGYVAGPMVAVTLSFYLLQVISLMMVGHLGELALSGTSIAVSLAGVTGFSLLVFTSIFKIQSFFSSASCFGFWYCLIILVSDFRLSLLKL